MLVVSHRAPLVRTIQLRTIMVQNFLQTELFLIWSLSLVGFRSINNWLVYCKWQRTIVHSLLLHPKKTCRYLNFMNLEKLHGLLLDNLNAAVLLLDENLSITYVNSAVESLLQMGNSRLLGYPIYEFFIDTEVCRQTLEDSLSSGNPHTRRHEYLRIPASTDVSQVD